MSFLISNSFPRPPLSLYPAPRSFASRTHLPVLLHPVSSSLPLILLSPFPRLLLSSSSFPMILHFPGWLFFLWLPFVFIYPTKGRGLLIAVSEGSGAVFLHFYPPLLSFALPSFPFSSSDVSQRIANFDLCRCICDGCLYRARIAEEADFSSTYALREQMMIPFRVEYVWSEVILATFFFLTVIFTSRVPIHRLMTIAKLYLRFIIFNPA